MEHEIGNISIARIRQMNPSLKGINNDFVMDRSEHYIPENMNPIFKYPLRLDGIIISIREKGSAKVNINLSRLVVYPISNFPVYGNTTLSKTI
jgi:AraC family transcriptional activator of pobA